MPPSTGPMRQASGNAHVRVEGRVGALLLEGVDRVDLEARVVGRHDEQGDALVLGDVGVGAGQQQDVGGEISAAGEHLLAVDDPVVAVAHRPGLGGENVGARGRLAVAERGDDLAGGQARQHRLLQVVGAVADDDVPDHVGHALGVGGDVERVPFRQPRLSRRSQSAPRPPHASGQVREQPGPWCPSPCSGPSRGRRRSSAIWACHSGVSRCSKKARVSLAKACAASPNPNSTPTSPTDGSRARAPSHRRRPASTSASAGSPATSAIALVRRW